MNTGAWIEALGWTLIHFVWQGALIGAFLWAILQLTRNARPQFRYLVACAALLGSAAFAITTFARELRAPRIIAQPVSTPATPPAFSIPAPSGAAEPGAWTVPTSDLSSIPALSSAEEKPSAPPSEPPPVVNGLDRAISILQRITPSIVLAWLIGVGVSSIRLWRSWRVVQSIRHSGEHTGSASLQKCFTALCHRLGARPATKLLVSAAVRVPMVVGWLKPLVLIPGSILSGLSPAQVEAILAHELAHIRRNDYLVNLLQNAIETVFFYHPAIWWISAQIRKEREHCCDDIASGATGGALHYVSALAALEQGRDGDPQLALAATGGPLLDRARRLLRPKPAEGPAQAFFAGGLALLVVVAVSAVPLAFLRAADPVATETKTERSRKGLATAVTDLPFRGFDEVKRGDVWPADELARLPFGPAHRTGLRAAWIFRPMQGDYALGDTLVCRIIIH